MIPFICGLEVHGYLNINNKEKLFCPCKIDRGAVPNTTICPRCTGMPGSKPMLPNKDAVEKIIACGLMLNCTIQRRLLFQRKHYSWPDMVNGYQRTMSGSYSLPVGVNGSFLGIGIQQVHLEEDPAKWDPVIGVVDYNRSGYPLIEIVTHPDFHSSEDVLAWLNNLLTTLSYIEGVETNAGIKCDVNISIPGHPRVEIKNVNSLASIKLAIEKEVERQYTCLKNKEPLIQHTRTPPDEHGRTIMMRSKETAEDYMFIPEPDLPLITLTAASIKRIKDSLPESPEMKKLKFQSLGLDVQNATIIASDLALADLFELVIKDLTPKQALRWIRHEILRIVNLHDRTLHELRANNDHIAVLLRMVDKGEITDAVAIQLLEGVLLEGIDPEAYITIHSLRVVEDRTFIRTIILKVIQDNPQAVQDYTAGKIKALNSLVGKVMAETKGKVPIDLVIQEMKEALK